MQRLWATDGRKDNRIDIVHAIGCVLMLSDVKSEFSGYCDKRQQTCLPQSAVSCFAISIPTGFEMAWSGEFFFYNSGVRGW